MHTSLTLVLAVSLLIACGGKEERKAKYLERGKAYFEEQNFDKARVEFKNVLQIDPKTAEAYMFIAEIEEREQNWGKAFRNYRKAAELDPDLIAARNKLAQFYLAQAGTLRANENAEGEANAIGLAQEQVAEVLARSASDPDGLTMQARLWALEGDTEKAIAQLQEVLSQQPGLSSAVISLAGLFEEAGQPEEAEQVLRNGLDAAQDPKGLRLQLGQFYIRQKQYGKAEQILYQLIEDNPERLAYRISLASLLAQTEQTDRAEQVLRDAITAAPDEAQRYVLLSEFLASRRDTQTAVQELEKFIQQNPGMNELKFAMVSLLLEAEREDEAKQVLEGIIAAQGMEPDALKARVMLAQMLAQQDPEAERVKSLLDEVLAENPRDNDALLMKGKLEARQGNYSEAIANFRSVLKDQPENAEVLHLLGSAHLANGERELARDTLSRAIEASPDNYALRISMARLLAQDDKADEAMEQVDEILKRDEYHENALLLKYELLGRAGDVAGMEAVAKLMQDGAPDKEEGYIREARLRMAQRDYDAALEIVDGLLEKNPQSAAALVTKSDVLVAQQKFDQAIEVAGKLIEVQPDSPQGYFRKARLLQEQGDVDGAFGFYEVAIEKAPDSEQILAEFTKLGISSGRGEEIKARLQRLIDADAKHPSAYGFIGLVHANDRDYAAAEQAFQRQLEVAPEQAESYTRLAQVREAQDNLEGAIAVFNRGLEVLPEDPQLMIGLAGIHERQKNFDLAIDLYEQVLQQQPENAISINNLAALLSDHRSDDSASLDTAAELAVKLEKTNQPAFLDTAGWVYYRRGEYEKALANLTRVVEKAPQVPVFQYHLGMVYYQMGDKAAAREHLSKATDGDYSYQGVEEARKTLESL
jgi:tetratricopeptide (TPR) repeat protein